jgi:hypothetical protein
MFWESAQKDIPRTSMNPPSAHNSPDLPQALTTIHPRLTIPHALLAARKNTCPPDPTGAFPVPFWLPVHYWALVPELGCVLADYPGLRKYRFDLLWLGLLSFSFRCRWSPCCAHACIRQRGLVLVRCALTWCELFSVFLWGACDVIELFGKQSVWWCRTF